MGLDINDLSSSFFFEVITGSRESRIINAIKREKKDWERLLTLMLINFVINLIQSLLDDLR